MESGGASGEWRASGKGKDDRESRVPDDSTNWVLDSSIDHKGRVPSRAKTGVWRAALFIIGIEFSERMSYFGLATNLIMYLTKVLGQELTTAAKNVNYWSGVTTMMPLVGGFISDSYLGRFNTVAVSSTIYLMGLGLLSMSQFIPRIKPPSLSSSPSSAMKRHEAIFFTSMYLISIGTGGHKPALESFGADQFDTDHPVERKQKMSYFNWWNTGLCSGLVAGVTLFVYLQDKAGWGVAYVALTVTMAISLVVFFAGKSFYRYKPLHGGSPVTPLVRVLAAAVAKRHLPYPADPALELYEIPDGKKLLSHTTSLRCLDKAAIVEGSSDNDAEQGVVRRPAPDTRNPWRLATVTEVEQLKQVIRMVPVWLTTQTFGLCVAQASTFFVKQASVMDRKLGPRFEIPPASIYSLAAIGMIVSVTIYDKVLIPFLRRTTGDERGITILQRIGIGMVFSSISMAVAALVERNRLAAAPVKISVWWLAPQFLIIGFGDGFALVGLQEYFYEQVPDGMRSLGIAFYLSVMGASNFLSSLLITVVDHVTSGLGSGRSWFAKDLNHSRLDCFYWLLAVLNAISVCAYVFVATKTVQRRRVASAAN